MKKVLLILVSLIFLGVMASASVNIDAVSYDPSPAIPGSYFNLYVTLKNDSKYDADNVVFELMLKDSAEKSDYPFSLDEGTNKFQSIGSIKSYQTALVKYEVRVDKEALDGDYNFLLQTGENGKIEKIKKYSVNVLSRMPKVELIDSSIKEAKPGQKIEIALTLKNIGSAKAINILVGSVEDRTVTTTGTVVDRQIYPLGSSFSYLAELNPNDESQVKIVFSIDPGADIKTNLIPIKITWEDQNRTSYTATRYLGLRVTEEPNLDAVVSEIIPAAFGGGTSQINIDLFNLSDVSAKNIVVELSSEAVESFDQQKIFIGTLQSDDSDTITVNAKFKSNLAKGNYPITLTVNFRNEESTEIAINKTLMIPVISAAEAGMPGIIGLITNLIILIVIIAVIAWLWKRRKKKKGN